ncbi:sulfatase [Aquiflexum gelatinilyticum]|uniref:sulfatase family protein n=1 Tax=Aquiflexum gelatinilyticum TaxID=2961943 RepID=UPI0021675279|nr:sulfatase [Aquiflexum gelatinilyticum]MCS4436055.1 sulfatase [Aquiflexum gelatinilyticum]
MGRILILTIAIILSLDLLGFSQDDRPNIIFILTDDQRWDALGFAGNQLIQTPEMDRLASEGIFFENAFVTTPICAASRASILTGTYERTHGYTFGQGEIKQPFIDQSYPAMMRNSGYNTGFFGKFGVNYSGFEGLFDISENYDRLDRYKDRRGYFYKTLGMDTVHLTRYTGQKAIEFIRQAPQEKPFMLSLSFSAPHAHDPSEEQYFWEKEFDSLYASQYFTEPPLSDQEYFDALPPYVWEGENRNRWYWRFDTKEKYQRSMKGYFRMISEIDHEIGLIREELSKQGKDKNTVIIFMSDNGYFLGERQLAGKWLMYDNSLRVPMIIYDPRSVQGRKVKDLVLNIDIAPTIFDLAGLDKPKSWQGLSLVGFLEENSPNLGREDFICEHLWQVEIIPPSEGLRTKDWKYFRYINDPQHEELYDLKSDPLEKNNLALNPTFNGRLIEMRRKFDNKEKELRN